MHKVYVIKVIFNFVKASSCLFQQISIWGYPGNLLQPQGYWLHGLQPQQRFVSYLHWRELFAFYFNRKGYQS